MRVWMVVCCLAGLALAGCAEEPADKPTGSQGEPRQSGRASVPAPVWQVGQYWSYEDSFGGGYSLVVVEDAGEDWVTWTDSLPVAYFDHAFDISFVGPMRKADLAGQQGEARIAFFEFPLFDGKSWRTMWDGVERLLEAHAEPDGTYRIVAHVSDGEAGAQYADYVYDAQKGFVTRMAFYDTATGEVAYAIELQDAGLDFAGEVVRYTEVKDAFTGSVSGAGQTMQGQFPVGAENEVAITATYDCGAGSGNLLAAVDDPDEGAAEAVPPAPFVNEPRYGFIVECPAAGNATEQVVLPAVAGTWRTDAVVGNQDGSVDIQVLLRSYETRSL